MAKIVERTLKARKGGALKDKSVVRNARTGEFITMHTVKVNSKTFASDLGKAFRSNVDAALRKKK